MLFGSLQKITAQQLGFNPVLIVTANSTGGVMGKMIDAQSIVVATASTGQSGQEGRILRFVFWHSVALAAIMGVIVMLQAYVVPVDDSLGPCGITCSSSRTSRGFPSTIRDLATDYLQFIQTRFRIDRAMTPLVRRLHGEDRHHPHRRSLLRRIRAAPADGQGSRGRRDPGEGDAHGPLSERAGVRPDRGGSPAD